MISSSQGYKVVPMVNATAATNATASASVDTLGWNYCTILVTAPLATATNNTTKLTVLKVAESNDNTTNFTNITSPACVGTTNTSVVTSNGEFLIPAWTNTSVPQTYRFNLDCRGGRMRYPTVVYQGPTGYATWNIVAILTKGNEAAGSTSEQGTLGAVIQ